MRASQYVEANGEQTKTGQTVVSIDSVEEQMNWRQKKSKRQREEEKKNRRKLIRLKPCLWSFVQNVHWIARAEHRVELNASTASSFSVDLNACCHVEKLVWMHVVGAQFVGFICK